MGKIFTKYYIIFLLYLILLNQNCNAQNSINSSGGEALGIGGNVSYTIGIVNYVTNNNNSGSVTQGVQHFYEINMVNVSEPKFDFSINIHPNPVTDELNIKSNNNVKETISYKMYNADGKIIQEGKLNEILTTIKMYSFPCSTYFLHLFNKKNNFKTYQIVKVQ